MECARLGMRSPQEPLAMPIHDEETRCPRSPDKMKMKLGTRRDGRVAEGARLESVYTFTGIGGSNPSLSAKFFQATDSSRLRKNGLLTSQECSSDCLVRR